MGAGHRERSTNPKGDKDKQFSAWKEPVSAVALASPSRMLRTVGPVGKVGCRTKVGKGIYRKGPESRAKKTKNTRSKDHKGEV